MPQTHTADDAPGLAAQARELAAAADALAQEREDAAASDGRSDQQLDDLRKKLERLSVTSAHASAALARSLLHRRLADIAAARVVDGVAEVNVHLIHTPHHELPEARVNVVVDDDNPPTTAHVNRIYHEMGRAVADERHRVGHRLGWVDPEKPWRLRPNEILTLQAYPPT